MKSQKLKIPAFLFFSPSTLISLVARAFFQELAPIALLYCSFSLQLPFLSFSLRQTLSLLLSSRRRQLLPPPTFLLVLAPPTSDLRLAPPHRPTLSSVTQPMEPLISGNLTSPALASNIRSGDLRVIASIAQIYKPYVLLRYVFLDSNFSMFSFFYKNPSFAKSLFLSGLISLYFIYDRRNKLPIFGETNNR